MASPAPRSLPTLAPHCPADRYTGGLRRVLVCDARAVRLPVLFPALAEALPGVIPLSGSLNLVEMHRVEETARLSWEVTPTAQGMLWMPSVELSLRPDSVEVIAWLESAVGMDLFVLATPPRAGVTWAVSPMRLRAARDSGAEYGNDPLWRYTFSPAQIPAKRWYRATAPTVTPPAPSENRGFSAGFSLGFG